MRASGMRISGFSVASIAMLFVREFRRVVGCFLVGVAVGWIFV